MADFQITIFLDGEKLKRIEDADLSGQMQEIAGKKAVQVGLSKNEHKKLMKSFPDLNFDASNSAVLPAQAEKVLMDFIASMKTLEVMKVAIMKLYNPLAGKALRSKAE